MKMVDIVASVFLFDLLVDGWSRLSDFPVWIDFVIYFTRPGDEIRTGCATLGPGSYNNSMGS